MTEHDDDDNSDDDDDSVLNVRLTHHRDKEHRGIEHEHDDCDDDDSSSSSSWNNHHSLGKDDSSNISLLIERQDSNSSSSGISLQDFTGGLSGLRKQEENEQCTSPGHWSISLWNYPFQRYRSRRGCCSGITRISGMMMLCHVILLFCLGIGGYFALHQYFSPTTTTTSTNHPRPPPPPPPCDDNATSAKHVGAAAFSKLDPVLDLGLADFTRPLDSMPPATVAQYQQQEQQPESRTSHRHRPIPTNAWYQNLILVDNDDNDDDDNTSRRQRPLSKVHRAYTIPYIVDAAGPIPGLRMHPANYLVATDRVVQVAEPNESHGLVLGTTASASASRADTYHDNDNSDNNNNLSFRYKVQHMTPLAITLEWGGGGEDNNNLIKMTSPIVKGMPYATMRYERLIPPPTTTSAVAKNDPINDDKTVVLLPTVASETPFGNKESVLVDGTAGVLDCHGTSNDDSPSSSSSPQVRVEHEIQIYIPASDFTWLVFFSEPVLVRCSPMKKNANHESEENEEEGSMLQIVGSAAMMDHDDNSASGDDYNNSNNKASSVPLIIRTAILNTCTTGKNPSYCQQPVDVSMIPWGQEDYGCILRRNAHLYPGPLADFSYAFVNNNNKDNNKDDDEEEEETAAILQFDWDVQDMGNAILAIESSDPDLIMFSLPHHRDMMAMMMDQATGFSCTGDTDSGQQQQLYCANSMLGPTCLIKGSSWNLAQDLPPVSFRAQRPPAPWAIQDIADSLRHDITYMLPEYFQRGAGDTYFSGKMLAKLGRILLIAEEMGDLCSATSGHYTANKNALDIDANVDDQDTATAYDSACAAIDLPTEDDVIEAIDSLRSSVEVWINGTAETPFVYDSAWGGVASCGCYFDGSHCQNKFPDCPGFYDSGLNFGNSFYNDMHFHYGYHIFAAAVVAHFDHDWGKRNFENVLLLIRNIANPSKEDSYFPIMRHMDIFQGHSWASGIAKPVVANGRNQESSSEAIAAYESVALYGKVMANVFESGNRNENEYYEVAKAVRGVGKVMSAMELRSVRRYYHVRQSSTRKAEIFPSAYTPHAVGIMWQTMAQFQTWFGNAPYLAYGIQLLPLTPMAEERDDVEWAKELYPSLAACCEADSACAENGWSVFQLSTFATVGHPQLAFERAQTTLSSQVFETAGGNGHSLSNTLWYIATRPPVEEPLPLIDIVSTANSSPTAGDSKLSDCHCPGKCTDAVLDTMADLYSCRQRIEWVMKTNGMSQQDACVQVAGSEYPEQCGLCNPLVEVDAVVAADSSGTDLLPQNAANAKAKSSDRNDDFKLIDCHRPETCNDSVLDTMAELYSCRQRIEWVMETSGRSQQDACVQVAGLEFPEECGLCNPSELHGGGR